MKKLSKTIAMVLIMVMLCGIFISCFTEMCVGLLESEYEFLRGVGFLLFVPALCLDLITLPIQVPMGLGPFKRSVYEIEGAVLLPEADGEFLGALAALLPEAERAALLEHIASLSEPQFIAEVKALHALFALPQAERVLLAEAIKSLPEEEQAFLTETRNSLSDAEMAALAEEFCSIPTEEMSRHARSMLKTPSSDWGYREYAARRLVTVTQR